MPCKVKETKNLKPYYTFATCTLQKNLIFSNFALRKRNTKNLNLINQETQTKTMKVVNFSETNSIINQYMAEIRDINYQQNRLLFRNNIERIGEMEAYEISKTLSITKRRTYRLHWALPRSTYRPTRLSWLPSSVPDCRSTPDF